MNCKNCGNPIIDGQKFCSTCGKPCDENLNESQTMDSGYWESNFSKLFSNVGIKIKLCSKICFCIFMGLALLSFITTFGERGNNSYAMIYAIVNGSITVFIGYLGAICMFGFGELLENIESIKKSLKSDHNI